MKPKTSFELYRWIFNFLIWFIGMGLIVFVSELVLAPGIRWLMYDIEYALPTLERVLRLFKYVLFMGVFVGTITWIYEKKATRR